MGFKKLVLTQIMWPDVNPFYRCRQRDGQFSLITDLSRNVIMNTYFPIGVKYFSYGSRLLYKCDEGYQLAWQQDEITTACQEDGQWTVGIAKMSCSAVTCEFTKGVLHGHVYEDSDVAENGFVAVTSLVSIPCTVCLLLHTSDYTDFQGKGGV